MSKYKNLVVFRLRCMLAMLAILTLGACSTLPAPQVSEKQLELIPGEGVDIQQSPMIAPLPTLTVSALDMVLPAEPLPVFVDEASVDCTARAIYFEARGESVKGWTAVGYVVTNRMKDPRFPNTACGVVHQQKKITNGKKVAYSCEFHWYCDGKPDLIRDQKTYAKILEVARQVLTQATANPVGGALFFHATYVKPQRARYAERHKVGNHIFYT